jgi:hypothetical protein
MGGNAKRSEAPYPDYHNAPRWHRSALTFQLSQSKLIGENRGCGTRRRKSYASTQLARLVGGGVPIYPELLVTIEEKNYGRFPRADPK